MQTDRLHIREVERHNDSLHTMHSILTILRQSIEQCTHDLLYCMAHYEQIQALTSGCA